MSVNRVILSDSWSQYISLLNKVTIKGLLQVFTLYSMSSNCMYYVTRVMNSNSIWSWYRCTLAASHRIHFVVIISCMDCFKPLIWIFMVRNATTVSDTVGYQWMMLFVWRQCCLVHQNESVVWWSHLLTWELSQCSVVTVCRPECHVADHFRLVTCALCSLTLFASVVKGICHGTSSLVPAWDHWQVHSKVKRREFH